MSLTVASTRARFIERMLLLRSNNLPEGPNWLYDLKLDGYRAIAVKTRGKVYLRSRNNKDFSTKYLTVATALAALPDDPGVERLDLHYGVNGG